MADTNSQRIKECRVCNNKFFPSPLLLLENMPRYAQYLPDCNNLKNDFGVNLEVHQCSKCGLIQLNNDPVFYYKESIRATSVSKEMDEFRNIQFKSFINNYNLKNKRILEIGCARGENLLIMNNLGVLSSGIEFSNESVDFCKKNGLDVKKNYFDKKNKIFDDLFDGFFILNFLEHLPNINTVLRAILNNIRANAVGLIEVPNFDMIYKKKLFSEFISDHLFYFTKETLKNTLEFNGFEVIDCSSIWQNYIISVVVRKSKSSKIHYFNSNKNNLQFNLDSFVEHKSYIKNDIDLFLSKYKNKEVAIWGAGHQALAVISLFNLSEKIQYVIDSAKFKQNKFTSASHLPIFPPEKISEKPIEAIMIIAGSFSNEVAKILLEDTKNNIDICILRDDGIELIRGE